MNLPNRLLSTIKINDKRKLLVSGYGLQVDEKRCKSVQIRG